MESLDIDLQKGINNLGISSFRHLFIISAPRSGSTLLRVNLNKVPDVVSPPETYFLEFYKANRGLNFENIQHRMIIADRWINFRNHLNARNLYDKEKFKTTIINHTRSWIEMFHTLILCYANDAGKKLAIGNYICEKTPLHIHYQNELIELFPQAKIIYLVRDPRDVVASLKTCPWGPSSVIRNALYWNQVSKLIGKLTNSLIVKYEEMVEQPDNIFQQIFAYLEKNDQNKLIQTSTNETKESVDPKNTASFKPIDNTFIGKWKSQLSEPDFELDIIETICYREMKRFGYSPTTSFNKKLYALAYIQSWIENRFHGIKKRII